MNALIIKRTGLAVGSAKYVPAMSGTLAALALPMLLSSLDTSIANVALPTLAKSFSAPFQQVQWIILAYLLTVTTLIVSAGRLGDLTGRRRLLLAGIFLFTLASVLCGAAPTLALLIAARAVQGLGAAIMMALSLAFVSDVVPRAKTGTAMGLLGATSAFGTALGPSLGGLLIAAIGWRAIFFVNVPLGIVALFLTRRFLPADRGETSLQRAGFDHAGTALLTFTLTAYVLAMTTGHGRFGAPDVALLGAAILGASLFIRIEAKAASPLIDLRVFCNPALSAGLAMSCLVMTVVMATLVVGPFYLSGALALGAVRVGLVMSCGPIVAALTGIPAGRTVDRFGAHRMALTGLGAMATGSFLLAVVPARFGIAGYLAPLVVITAGYALFQAANNTTVMTNIGPDQRGVISGMLSLSRNLGLISGVAFMGTVFNLGSKAAGVTAPRAQAVAAGLHVTFGIAALLIIVALVTASISHALLKPKRVL